MNLIETLDASGTYACEADYFTDLNNPNMHWDGGLRAAVQRKAERSGFATRPKADNPGRYPADTPTPERISWANNPGRFPTDDDQTVISNQETK